MQSYKKNTLEIKKEIKEKEMEQKKTRLLD